MKIGVIGCQGRMGRVIVKAILTHPDCTLAGAVAKRDHDVIGQDAGELIYHPTTGVMIHADMDKLYQDSDAVIEFTNPQTCIESAALAAEYGTILISGTTGLSSEDKAKLAEYAKKTPIVWAENMSLGMNLLMRAVEELASELGPEVDIEISERHHKHKKDAPSGSAYALAEVAARGRGKSLDEVLAHRTPTENNTRTEGDIGISFQRAGEARGRHSVLFAMEGEVLELTHTAYDRSIFAKGAVQSALWAKDKPAGFYGMKDVLGF